MTSEIYLCASFEAETLALQCLSWGSNVGAELVGPMTGDLLPVIVMPCHSGCYIDASG